MSVIHTVSYLATYQNRTETEYSEEACTEREKSIAHFRKQQLDSFYNSSFSLSLSPTAFSDFLESGVHPPIWNALYVYEYVYPYIGLKKRHSFYR